MKKFYTLLPIFFLGLLDSGFAQYTATNSGPWSSSLTWAPGVRPSQKCNSCTITINDGVSVVLDVTDTLTGNSLLKIGQTGGLVSAILINNSNSTTLGTGYGIMLDSTSNSKILLTTPTAQIIATSAGKYDGIFAYSFNNLIGLWTQEKAVGNAPSYFINGNSQYNVAPKFQTLSGPASLGSNGTLPIILSKFDAVLNNNIVNLSWSTSTEINFSHFDVLRSGDGSTWAKIGTVAGKNAANGADYFFADQLPLHGINYYRLSEVDLDGKATLSEIKQIQTATSLGLKFGPNPANDHVGVTFGNNISSAVTIRLFNQYGQALQEKQLSNVAGTTYTMSLSNYPAGIYAVQVKSQDGSQNSSFRVLLAH